MWLALFVCIVCFLLCFAWVHERSHDDSVATYRAMKSIAHTTRVVSDQIYTNAKKLALYTIKQLKHGITALIHTLERIRHHKERKIEQKQRAEALVGTPQKAGPTRARTLKSRIEKHSHEELTSNVDMLE